MQAVLLRLVQALPPGREIRVDEFDMHEAALGEFVGPLRADGVDEAVSGFIDWIESIWDVEFRQHPVLGYYSIYKPERDAPVQGTWDAFGNSGMRYPEANDLTGGEGD